MIVRVFVLYDFKDLVQYDYRISEENRYPMQLLNNELIPCVCRDKSNIGFTCVDLELIGL